MLGTHHSMLPSTNRYYNDVQGSITRSHDPYLVEELVTTSMVTIISNNDDVV